MAGWSMQRVLHFLRTRWRECEMGVPLWRLVVCLTRRSVWAPAARRVRRKKRVRSADAVRVRRCRRVPTSSHPPRS